MSELNIALGLWWAGFPYLWAFGNPMTALVVSYYSDKITTKLFGRPFWSMFKGKTLCDKIAHQFDINLKR
jgi:hypothetical protein